MEEVLQHLGYSRSKSLIYITLLKNGPLNASKIAKHTGLSRVAVYDALRHLLSDGIVNETLNKSTKIFLASNPKKIRKKLDQKKEQIQEDENVIEKMFSLFHESKEETGTKVYYGFSGIKNFYEDFLDHADKEWLVLGVPKRAELLGGYFKNLSDRRYNKKIKLKIIYNKEAGNMAKVRKKQELSEVRILPDDYITPASIDILSDRIGITIYSAEPIVFTLVNKDVAKSFQNYFEIIWKKSTKI